MALSQTIHIPSLRFYLMLQSTKKKATLKERGGGGISLPKERNFIIRGQNFVICFNPQDKPIFGLHIISNYARQPSRQREIKKLFHL